MFILFFQPRQNSSTPSTTVSSTNLQTSNNTLTSEAAMREQLLKKERELLELQKKKIELELLQAKASLEQQQRQLYKQVVNMKTDQVRKIVFFYTARFESRFVRRKLRMFFDF